MVELTKEVEEQLRQAVLEFLRERVKIDDAVAEACRKPNKTLDGIINYLDAEIKKRIKNKSGFVGIHVKDEDVYDMVVHYLLEDELDSEPTMPVNDTVQETSARDDEEVIEEDPKTIPRKKKTDPGKDGQLTLFDMLEA